MSRKNKMTKKKGGIVRTNYYQDDTTAFTDFVNGCKIRYLTHGASGMTFVASFLLPESESPYTHTNANLYGIPVKQLLIKIGFIGDENGAERSVGKFSLIPASRKTFIDEVNIQTDVYLKSMAYLQPICPCIVFARIYSLQESDTFLQLMLQKVDAADPRTESIVRGAISSQMSVGVIGMEYADNYGILHNFRPEYTPGYGFNKQQRDEYELYKTMSLYLLLRLAVETGYTHGDFHDGNIMINPTQNDYFDGIPGSPLLIDFGRAAKIPSGILTEIETKYREGKHTPALRKLCEIPQPAPHSLNLREFPTFYGYACGTYDNVYQKPTVDFSTSTSSLLSELVESRQIAIADIKQKFANLSLPLSKSSLMFTGWTGTSTYSLSSTMKNWMKYGSKIVNKMKKVASSMVPFSLASKPLSQPTPAPPAPVPAPASVAVAKPKSVPTATPSAFPTHDDDDDDDEETISFYTGDSPITRDSPIVFNDNPMLASSNNRGGRRRSKKAVVRSFRKKKGAFRSQKERRRR
jgi:hypothetical protein